MVVVAARPHQLRRRITRVRYQPYGAARQLFACRADEVLLSGPAGTGKSLSSLQKLHLAASKYPRMRGLIGRKTRVSITESAMVTFEHKVLHPLDGVRFHHGDQEYRYPNGSVIVVAGFDKPTKIHSTEYDMAYVQEATELNVEDWETVTTRLRNGVMPYQQLLADCNPDRPDHWLKQRCDQGVTVMLDSRHQDNPTYWDAAKGVWTSAGLGYLAKLERLTGVRKLRLKDGLWVAAEGLVYDGWDRRIHLLDRFEIPAAWPRFWVVDFGYTNPFVWQAWAMDPDGRLYCYREIYFTHRLVEDHARTIKQVTQGEPRPRAIICDHDAEDRATLERHLGIKTIAAKKAISPGIQHTAVRLRPAGDGKPRLFFLRDALVETDPELVDAKKPLCSEQEIEGYVWDTSAGRKRGEQPVDQDNHGMDCTRYVVAHFDLQRASRLVSLNWN